MKLTLLLLALALAPSPARAAGSAPEESPLFKAATRGDLRALKGFAKSGADLSGRDGDGRSGLILGAAYNHPLVVQFFLERSPDVDGRDMQGYTALHYAAQNGNAAVARKLLAGRATPQVYTKRCLSPLDIAALYGHKRLFDELRPRHKKTPLPKDGTVEECRLDKRKDEGYDALRLSTHTRLLTVEGIEDYGFAMESLRLLGATPALGRQLIPRIVQLVDHPSPPGAAEYPAYDMLVRTNAISTLDRLARTKPLATQVADKLVRLVEAGGCGGYKVAYCTEDTVNECKSDELWTSLGTIARLVTTKARPAPPPWPRPAGAEVCFNCTNCQTTRVGNGFKAALAWFRLHRDQAPRAEMALQKLVKRGVLPKDEAARLRKEYLK